LKSFEKPIFKAIERIWDEVTVAKGLNADETGRLMQAKFDLYSTCAAVGLDASKFDKHVSVPMPVGARELWVAIQPRPRVDAIVELATQE